MLYPILLPDPILLPAEQRSPRWHYSHSESANVVRGLHFQIPPFAPGEADPVSRYYSREHDRGLLWNDPDLGIDWQLKGAEALLSDRDRAHPVLTELPRYFS